jgi:hypothetical protein
MRASGHEGRGLRFVLIACALAQSCALAAPTLGPSPSVATSLIACAPTIAHDSRPSGETANGYYHGNGQIWTELWPNGVVVARLSDVQPDGSIVMKFPWWRGVTGSLQITGHRLDRDAPPLEASVPAGYGSSGFQASSITFPSAGCWAITGSVGQASLSFVTLVTVP